MKSTSFVLGVLALLTTGGGALTASCSSDSTPGAVAGDAGSDAAGGALTPSLACADAVDAIYGDPGALAPDPAKRGDVLKCIKDPDICDAPASRPAR